jgi:hypothetical protein
MNAPHPGAGPKLTGPKGNQEHLAQWMDRHSNLPPAEQQRALEKEPGFRDLPPQTQQRMRDRLTQLNNMTPEQRRRTLERTEAIEHLTPPQRQQWRGAMEQYQGLPEDRRRMVARAFRDSRDAAATASGNLNQDRFRDSFLPEQHASVCSRSNRICQCSDREMAIPSASNSHGLLREVAARRRLFFIAGRGWGYEGRTPFAFWPSVKRYLRTNTIKPIRGAAK